MHLLAQSEWMEDQKLAVVMAPGKQFEVIQTPTGRSVFFSIGSDHVFYVTREKTTTATGWTRLDLSSRLATVHPGSKPSVKSFSVAQNLDTLFFDIALIVTSGNSDYLYLSLGNNSEDDIGPGIQWQETPFDDPARSATGLTIDSVYLLNQPTPGKPSGTQTCFVDVLQGTSKSNVNELLDRYYIAESGQPRWQKQTLPIDLKAGSISTCQGLPADEPVAGMYTLGKIQAQSEVIFRAAFNAYDPNIPPSPIRFKVSETTRSITSSLVTNESTVLFLSDESGIAVFGADEQTENTQATRILSSAVTRKASQLKAESCAGITVLYGVSQANELFYCSCPTGKETLRSSWTVPMTLVSSIQNFSFFVNKKSANQTLFALSEGTEVFQLTQDPVTGDWASRNILLPSTDINAVAKFSSFSTRIIIKDDNSKNNPRRKLAITAESPVGVYVNNVYKVLNPVTATEVVADASGVVKISQPTQDSVAIRYRVSVTSDPNQVLVVDPASKMKQKLASIKSADDLDKAKVQQENGTFKKLIPDSVKRQDREAAATAIGSLVQVAANLTEKPPSKPDTQDPNAESKVREVARFTPSVTFQASAVAGTTPGEAVEDLLVKAGDLFRSILYTAWDGLKSFVIRIVGKVHEVVVQIGKTIYRAILDTISAVTHAVEWVFQKIQVTIDDLKKWLGFLFNWGDIVRTHKVVKNLVTTYATHSISRINDLQEVVTNTFDGLEEKLNAWAGLPVQEKTMGRLESGTRNSHPTVDDPQTHYIHDKAEAHLGDSNVVAEAIEEGLGEWKGILDRLVDFGSKEKDAVLHLVEQVKKEIIEPFRTLTITEVIKKLAAIVGTLVLETAKNVVNLTLDLLKDMGTAIIAALNEPIKIPILSKVYEEIADEPLSIMDLICLAAAVPTTLLYKAVTGDNPFPDDAVTNSLIGAKDFRSIQKTMKENPVVYKKFTIVSEFVAMAGLFFEVIANTLKLPQMTVGEPHEVPDKLKQVSVGVKLLTIMPSFIRPRSSDDAWYWKMDDMVTDLAFLKACLDATKIGEQGAYGKVSPFIDYGISVAWLVPTIGKVVDNHQSKNSTYTSLTTSLAYDIAVMTGPIVWNPSIDPESKLIVFGVANGVLLICGVVRVATAGLLHDGA